MYKVFVENKPIFLTNDSDFYKSEKSVLYVQGNSAGELYDAITALENCKSLKSIFFFCKSPSGIIDEFIHKYNYIEAAGGLVNNLKNELLFIFRNEKWDLPKGKLEGGESPEDGAVREVEEECGIENLQIITHLKDTYHTYRIKGKIILKKTFWYKMSSSFNKDLTPQTEEGITKVEWRDPKHLSDIKNNTYASIIEVLD